MVKALIVTLFGLSILLLLAPNSYGQLSPPFEPTNTSTPVIVDSVEPTPSPTPTIFLRPWKPISPVATSLPTA